ncbi:MAG: hypothetical protein HY855_03940 [Burkholderiales bacterium]|nr:hypothetical protein [Burkholderiales bacterium]
MENVKALLQRIVVFVCVALCAGMSQAQNLAPGFAGLQADAKVVIAPIDVELFSVSAGGVLEPMAEWTDAAQRHMKTALMARATSLGLGSLELSGSQADDLAELLSLHAAVARSISIHHRGALKLPTKEDKLDWSFGDVLRPLWPVPHWPCPVRPAPPSG